MYRLKLKNNEINLAAGIGNSTTVNSATLIRVVNSSGGSVVIRLQNSEFTGIASITMLNNTTEIIEKTGSDLIHVLGGTVQVAKVGFTQ
ncbi:hypothetical protein [Synechococcus phage DSL-LC03]|nr:hypothetical protein [Synechococcus phage DSL-LC03]